MKKIVFIAFAVILCAFCLTACGNVEGTYYFDSITYGDLTYEAGQEIPMGDEKFKYEKDSYKLELKKDGNGTIIENMPGTESSMTTELTWKLSDDKKSIILTVEDEDEETLEIDGNKLIMKVDEDTNIILKK